MRYSWVVFPYLFLTGCSGSLVPESSLPINSVGAAQSTLTGLVRTGLAIKQARPAFAYTSLYSFHRPARVSVFAPGLGFVERSTGF